MSSNTLNCAYHLGRILKYFVDDIIILSNSEEMILTELCPVLNHHSNHSFLYRNV